MVNQFDSMIGSTLVTVQGKVGDDVLSFHTTDGRVFRFFHDQDCCETVSVEDITGDLEDLLGSPLVEAEEVDNTDAPEIDCESYTWTFYRFGTAKGSVTVRWLGTSNGYYSESVYFEEA